MKAGVSVTKNFLSREECQNIINSFHTWERDYIKNDTSKPEKTFSKEELDANTEIDPEGYKIRQVSQSGTDYITEWDGLPVYRCKVMKYEEGDFDKNIEIAFGCARVIIGNLTLINKQKI